MQIKKLHIELPPLCGYLHHAYHLSVAQEHPSFNQWFNANYIQLRYHPKINWLNFYRLDTGKFDYCPFIDYHVLNNEIIRINQINLIDFAINCIKQGYFVWLFIDEYYDPNKESYKNTHFIHENLLYGFNRNKNYFYSMGFNQYRIYSFLETNFSDLLKSFNGVANNYTFKILKPNKDITCEFDIENVKNIIKDYISGENTSERNRMFNKPSLDCVYGIEIYKYLKLYFESLLNTKSLSDFRLLHIFWEHKKCMVSRIKYLYENKYLKSLTPFLTTYEAIEKKVLLLRNMQLKYNLAIDDKITYKIIASLDEIRDEEISILTKLMECY